MNQYYPYGWDVQAFWKKQHALRMRRTYSQQGWTLLIYLGIMYVAVFAVMMIDTAVRTARSLALVGTVDEEWIWDAVMADSGWGYMLAIAIGTVVLLAWKKPQYMVDTVFQRNRPMTVSGFFKILCVFMSAQTLFLLMYMLSEYMLNQFGMTTTDTGVDSDGLSMFLYVGLGAPISEEILFRGLVLRSMEPYGKKFAIFSSALLFGLFHGNLSQTPFAFCVGLVLGYVALEHNILWAMVLHMFNNLIYSDALGRISTLLPVGVGDLIAIVMLLYFAVGAVVILIVERKKVSNYFRSNPDDPGCAKAFWTAPGVLVLVSLLVVSIIYSLTESLVPL